MDCPSVHQGCADGHRLFGIDGTRMHVDLRVGKSRQAEGGWVGHGTRKAAFSWLPLSLCFGKLLNWSLQVSASTSFPSFQSLACMPGGNDPALSYRYGGFLFPTVLCSSRYVFLSFYRQWYVAFLFLGQADLRQDGGRAGHGMRISSLSFLSGILAQSVDLFTLLSFTDCGVPLKFLCPRYVLLMLIVSKLCLSKTLTW
ncbi:hypothetical protein BCR44DRAFT_252390 [Catenaria anguillulae PL171]|uniref:Uncharacterized protein n=1 Tax=Catenaria anguillulae PL171 TaxID=765915 RepID=A0A1Y2H485_9FUNG|nr:hypothetical protein BCR44DRAFT_252390 [Catenaria anguillulae PL171]